MPYTLKPTRYAPAGSEVQITNTSHHPVMIVRVGEGQGWPIKEDGLTDTVPLYAIKPDPAIERLKEAMRAELKKGRTKFKTLVGCVRDGLINKPMPGGITKEQWLLTANEILK